MHLRPFRTDNGTAFRLALNATFYGVIFNIIQLVLQIPTVHIVEVYPYTQQIPFLILCLFLWRVYVIVRRHQKYLSWYTILEHLGITVLTFTSLYSIAIFFQALLLQRSQERWIMEHFERIQVRWSADGAVRGELELERRLLLEQYSPLAQFVSAVQWGILYGATFSTSLGLLLQHIHPKT
jgi:hypothetical protein